MKDWIGISKLKYSPKSIEACRKTGNEPKDLYQIPFDEFVSLNPEIKGIVRELQVMRYNFHEKTRLDNIRNCKEVEKFNK